MQTYRDKKLLCILGYLGNSLKDLSFWRDTVKQQSRATHSIFKLQIKCVNVAIAFQVIHSGAAIPEVERLVSLDFYFYFNHENKQYEFIKSQSCLANLYFFKSITCFLGQIQSQCLAAKPT